MNRLYLRMEVRRLMRNRRVLLTSVLMPVLLLIVIGGMSRNDTMRGVTGGQYITVSMGLFGSMAAAIGCGGTIAVERGLGWNRQLRTTPLSPGRYVLTKLIVSLLAALPPLLLTFLTGVLALGVRLSPSVWVQVLAGSWLSALPFAALGITVGYLARPDGVQQLSALLIMLLAIFGGLWVPVEVMPHLMHTVATYTPAYWAGQVARAPLFHGDLNPRAVVVLLAWTAGLGLIALWRFRADAARA